MDILYSFYWFISMWTFGSFPFLTIMKTLAVNRDVHVFAWTHVILSLRCIHQEVELLCHMLCLGALDCEQQQVSLAVLNKTKMIGRIVEPSRIHKGEAKSLSLENGTRVAVAREWSIGSATLWKCLGLSTIAACPAGYHLRVKVQERAYRWSSPCIHFPSPHHSGPGREMT